MDNATLRARVLSVKEMREIVMRSGSDEDKYYASQESEDEGEPRPPSQRSSISQPPSPDYSASSSEDRLRWSRGSVLAFSTQVRGFKPRLFCQQL